MPLIAGFGMLIHTKSRRTDGELVEFLYPTLYVAQKWLRETKNLHIEICYSDKLFWHY